MAGGQGQGDALNQLHFPFTLDIDGDGTLFIADKENHRIVRWRPNAKQGEIVAGGTGRGSQSDQLDLPRAVLLDRTNDYLITSDWGNRRVMRWPCNPHGRYGCVGEIIVPSIRSLGLAMDEQGSLYISDFEKHEVRRYGREDRKDGVLVAGGNGQGAALDQLNVPRQIFVDADCSVFVSDSWNHRVMKWMKGASEGMVVAGGQRAGNSRTQLSSPSGIFVDQMGSVYVADQGNDRVMRWAKGAREGEVILGGSGEGTRSNQFNVPESISLDNHGNLYVVDRDNHRIQRFDLQ